MKKSVSKKVKKEVSVKSKITLDKLAMMMANGFRSVDERFDKLEAKVDRIEVDVFEIKRELGLVKEEIKIVQKRLSEIEKIVGKEEVHKFQLELATIKSTVNKIAVESIKQTDKNLQQNEEMKEVKLKVSELVLKVAGFRKLQIS